MERDRNKSIYAKIFKLLNVKQQIFHAIMLIKSRIKPYFGMSYFSPVKNYDKNK